ncbi:MAG: PorT family protein [Cytophagaceae bacterium]|nr:PorT family protein [Cytophagaceae bacterium]
MKNVLNKTLVISCLILATLCAIPTYAQSRDGFAFGIKAGVNLSRFNGARYQFGSGGNFLQNADKDNVGAIGGVFLRFGTKFYVQPEAVLSQKGGRFQILRDNQNINDARNVDVRFSNLDVPILFGVRIGEVLRLNLGPVASFRLADNGNLKSTLNEYSGQSVDNVFRSAALGYQAGIGLDFGRINFDVRYEGNINDVIRVDFNNPSTNAQFARKISLFQATLGFEIL